MIARTSVDRALAALAERLTAERAEAAWLLNVTVSYRFSCADNILAAAMPVALMSRIPLAQPSDVTSGPLGAALLQAIDDWIVREAAPPGLFEFSFDWGDGSGHPCGRLTYP